MELNKTQNVDPNVMRNRAVVNTAEKSVFWTNKTMVQEVFSNNTIRKTPTQNRALAKLVARGGSLQALTPGEKRSLTALEGNRSFEGFLNARVKAESFKEIGPGQPIHDMNFRPFESELRAKPGQTAPQNDYVNAHTTLLDYINSKPNTRYFVINACSEDGESEFTGCQIDLRLT